MAYRESNPTGAPFAAAAVLYFESSLAATKHNRVPAGESFVAV